MKRYYGKKLLFASIIIHALIIKKQHFDCFMVAYPILKWMNHFKIFMAYNITVILIIKYWKHFCIKKKRDDRWYAVSPIIRETYYMATLKPKF